MASKKTKGKSGKATAPNPDRPLTARQQAFVVAFTGEAKGNATRAAVLAGYQGGERACAVMGCKLVRNANILAAIEQANAEVKSAAIADRQERQEFYTKVLRGEEDEEVLMTVSAGQAMGSCVERERKQVSARDRLKAAELLAKTQGDFITKVEIESADGLRGMLTQLGKLMSPAAFKELVAAIAKAGAATVEGK
jgi:phage terminase small subunit